MYFEAVKEFMIACDQTVDRYNEEQSLLYLKLCEEEWQEYIDAETDVDRLDACCDLLWVAIGGMYSSNANVAWMNTEPLLESICKEEFIPTVDKIKITEKMFDDPFNVSRYYKMILSSLTTAHKYGWDFDGAFNEVARTNMLKVDPETGKVRKREDGKVLKPEGWAPPDLSSFV